VLAPLVLLAALACPSPAAAARPFSVEPPPGWEDLSEQRAGGDVLISLKGPETSSFVLTRVPRLPLENRVAVRAFLADVLAALNRRTGLEFSQSSGLLTESYENGPTFLYMKADLKGKPRLVIGVADFGGEMVLGTLISAVPDLLMPAVFGGLRAAAGAKAAAAPVAGPVQSFDGQLLFALPNGVAPRELSDRERKMGFVLALQGLSSELMVLKVVDDDAAPPKVQPQIVRQTVLDAPSVVADSLSPVQLIDTPPGPDLVYAFARVQDAANSRFLAGFMPWGYTGYSILAKGSDPEGLLKASFSALSLGPSALPKVVSSTPPIPVPRELRLKLKKNNRQELVAGGAALVLLTLVWALWPRRVVGAT
jgi:hypothetical protein